MEIDERSFTRHGAEVVDNSAASESETQIKSKAKVSSKRKSLVYFGTVAFLLGLFVVLGIGAGSVSIAPEIVVRVLLAQILPVGWVETAQVSEAQQVIVWLVRAPRVVVAALVGASLALAGAQMQGLFKNPLASPDIIGTSAGGALGAVLAFAAGLAARSLFYLPVFAFVGSFVALFAVYFIATRRGRTPIATLLLAGIALGALIGAAISFVITSTSVRFEVAQEILFWLLGGLDNRTWAHVWIALPCVLLGTLISIFYTRELDLLLAGEEVALSLGVEVEQTKRILLTVTALLTGAAVAVSGVVGFVGLIVPHIVRQFLGPRHGTLLPASALTGAAFLVAADLLARTLLRPEEIRLGIVTAAFGAPFFLYLLLRHRREVDY
jgi:iron complex transport system permease protein